MEKNTPKLWDHLWKEKSSYKKNYAALEKEEKSIRWQRIEKIVLQEFGFFKGLRVIEVGAGSGINSALMAKRGAATTVLDYSKNALERAKELFNNQKLLGNFKPHDALHLPQTLLNCYDISMSFGLAEHFRGSDRLEIIKSHFDVLRKGGITFISVPNKYNFPYRIFKFRAESTGNWIYGEEFPFSRKELKNICYKLGIKKYYFFGDSLISSLNFIFPLTIFERRFRLKRHQTIFRKIIENGTFLDHYLSYALVLCGRK